ncbi:MAG: iron ABC transporter permease [Eubacteriales bacterium]
MKADNRVAGATVRYTVMLALLILICAASLRFGSSAMSTGEFIGALLRTDSYKTQSLILYSIRLPRMAGALVAGIGLSVSGVLLQSVTANELAAPNIIGVNSGAGFAVILTLFLFPAAFAAIPLAAFVGAFTATLIIVAAANRISASKTAIVLAGIALTAMLNACISFITLLDTDTLASYNYFSIGGLAGVRVTELYIPAAITLCCLALSLVIARRINLLALGDAMACSLGVNVRRLRLICLVLASASAAAVVSYAGLLGFVGLVVPHIARRISGGSVREVLCTSAICGGILVVAADLAGRVLFAPSEVPVGIIMAFIGAPFFFFLLFRRNGGSDKC